MVLSMALGENTDCRRLDVVLLLLLRLLRLLLLTVAAAAVTVVAVVCVVMADECALVIVWTAPHLSCRSALYSQSWSSLDDASCRSLGRRNRIVQLKMLDILSSSFMFLSRNCLLGVCTEHSARVAIV